MSKLLLQVQLDPFDSPFFYPGFISLLTASVMFPPGSGQFMAAHLSSAQQMIHLFSNFPWSGSNLTLEQHKIVAHWTTYRSGIFCHLSVLIAFTVSVYSLSHLFNRLSLSIFFLYYV